MNDFKVSSITKGEEPAKTRVKSHIFVTVLAIILGFLALKGITTAVLSGKDISVKNVMFSAFSKNIQVDEHGNTNILLLGVGGEGHDGENLTDTMIVASIDHEEKIVSMLSIPRDFYVDSEFVGYGTRINGVYELVGDKTGSYEAGMTALQTEIENVFNIKLQYYAKVDFNGFKDIVDAIGGVDVYVEESIYDATYPAAYGLGYSPFYIEEGQQTLDGETALKYVRSRHTTLDFGRAARQQQVIAAIKDKALSTGFLLNPGKIKDLYSAVSSNFETNLSITEILYLAKISENFDQESIHSEVITDVPNEAAGFLYTPLLADYGGAYVLIPYAGDNREIETFAHYFLFEPSVFDNKTEIKVYNGTKNGGLAALVKMHLVRYGFNVINFGNAIDREQLTTKIYIEGSPNEELEETFKKLQEFIPSTIFENPSEEVSTTGTGTIIIELGEDFMDYYRANKDVFYEGYY